MEFTLNGDVVCMRVYSKPYDFKDAKGIQKTGISYKADLSIEGAFTTLKTNEIVFKKLETKQNETISGVYKLSFFDSKPLVYLVDLK